MPALNAQTPAPKILVVDDDPSVRTAVAEFLSSQGYAVLLAEDGIAMRRILEQEAVAIVILDVMLPGDDGLKLARELRQWPELGVIMLSARGSEADRVMGLEMGADDYLPKPASPRELLARVRAVLRRYGGKSDQAAGGFCFVFDGWTLNPVRRVLRDPQGLLISLSEGEFELLLAFVENPKTVLSRDQLLELARGLQSEAFDRAIDVQVSRLRRKLAGCLQGDAIRTVRGEGYLFGAEVARA
ncbi:MAG: response regulator [Novosphingobium sp.]|nr:response regulator [Novosphingobium sp.]